MNAGTPRARPFSASGGLIEAWLALRRSWASSWARQSPARGPLSARPRQRPHAIRRRPRRGRRSRSSANRSTVTFHSGTCSTTTSRSSSPIRTATRSRCAGRARRGRLTGTTATTGGWRGHPTLRGRRRSGHVRRPAGAVLLSAAQPNGAGAIRPDASSCPHGTEDISVQGHLSRVDVKQGDTIADRTRIGLSGNTGCSGTPHLHFGAFRGRPNGEFVAIDPYGWHAAGEDPWEVDPRGLPSVWLWKDGAAPSLR